MKVNISKFGEAYEWNWNIGYGTRGLVPINTRRGRWIQVDFKPGKPVVIVENRNLAMTVGWEKWI